MKRKLLVCAMTILLVASTMYGCSSKNNKKVNDIVGEKGNR